MTPQNKSLARAAQSGVTAVNVVRSAIPLAELTKGANEVLIQHAGEIYKLRVTKLGKLILTK